LPMAIGFGDGAEIRTPMAITVIAGLLSSTVLTLLVIPTIYAMFDGLAVRLLRSRTHSDTPVTETSPGRLTQ